MICSICNGGPVKIHKEKHEVKIPFGDSVFIENTIYNCDSCEEDWIKDDSESIDKIVSEGNNIAVKNIISKLRKNYSLVDIERIFGLPFNSIEKLNVGYRDSSSFALAFLRCIASKPELIDIADNGFKPEKKEGDRDL
jgi:hypothetical protein